MLTNEQDGMTALHVVSSEGYHAYFSFDIYDQWMINKKDNAGNIPSHLACKKGHLKIVED